MKNKIHKLFKTKNKNVLCIYFTAGYPTINSTIEIVQILQKINHVDLIEIGIPYSDPLADGIIIQNSNYISLKNGMNVSLLFSQIEKIKNTLEKPIVLMGYFNQFYQFGDEKFLKKCNDTNISGLILPDLPIDIFIKKYRSMFKKYSISMIFLITPQTDISRISMISNISDSFLYLVSSNSITGNNISFGKEQISFFKKINYLSSMYYFIKKVPKLIGFGINNKKTYNLSCKYANGGIIGSSFIKSIEYNNLKESIENYIKSIVC